MIPHLIVITLVLSQLPLPLNDKVVEFARSNLGRKVGDGECTALASEALRAAGASDRPPWGDLLMNLADARPGDILLFENVVFLQRKVRDDGAVVRQTLKSPRHAAIVSAVERVGKDLRLTVLHQNSGLKRADEEAKKTVQEWTFRLSEKKSGTLKVYRPVVPGAARPPQTRQAISISELGVWAKYVT